MVKSLVLETEAVLAVLAVLLASNIFCEAAVCHTNQITPINVDFDELAKKKINFLYVPRNDLTRTLDHAYMELTKTGNNTYNASTTIVYKSHGKSFADYVLKKTEENGMLVYRCFSDPKVLNGTDLRFIIAPEGITLTDESVNLLLEADRKFSLSGDLLKLPRYL